jgi:hypothetical protein
MQRLLQRNSKVVHVSFSDGQVDDGFGPGGALHRRASFLPFMSVLAAGVTVNDPRGISDRRLPGS